MQLFENWCQISGTKSRLLLDHVHCFQSLLLCEKNMPTNFEVVIVTLSQHWSAATSNAIHIWQGLKTTLHLPLYLILLEHFHLIKKATILVCDPICLASFCSLILFHEHGIKSKCIQLEILCTSIEINSNLWTPVVLSYPGHGYIVLVFYLMWRPLTTHLSGFQSV